jgi:hypothetical protein
MHIHIICLFFTSAYSMPGTVLSTLQTLTHSNSMRKAICPLTNEKTEAYIGLSNFFEVTQLSVLLYFEFNYTF